MQQEQSDEASITGSLDTDHKLTQLPVGIVVNVKTHGRKRLISFESQLLLSNNLVHPITLVFRINQINQHRQDLLDKKAKGTFEEGENLAPKKKEKDTAKEMMEQVVINMDENESEMS